MKQETRYHYEKRIKELEAKLSIVQEQHDQYRDVCAKVYDWLHAFGKAGPDSPNAAFGLALFKPLIWRMRP